MKLPKYIPKKNIIPTKKWDDKPKEDIYKKHNKDNRHLIIIGIISVFVLILILILIGGKKKPVSNNEGKYKENYTSSKKSGKLNKQERGAVDLPEGELGEWAKAVVFIEGGYVDYDDNMFYAKKSGTGFVINSKGEILTNEHVISESEAIMVTYFNGNYTLAKINKANKELDIALLLAEKPDDVKPINLGPEETVKIGRPIMVLGFPLGSALGNEITLTKGIISSIRRMDNNEQGWYQIDAAVNSGNSGGPLIDPETGKVLGVITAKIQGADNIGFARPIEIVKKYFLD